MKKILISFLLLLLLTTVSATWYNSDWQAKRSIQFTNSIDYNKWNVLKIETVNMSSWTIQLVDYNDVIVVDETLDLDLNRIVNCNSGKTDCNVFFELPANLSAGTHNDRFYIYYNNATASKPKKDTCKGQCDRFEDGDYTINPTFGFTAGNTASVQTTIKKTGVYALTIGSARTVTELVTARVGSGDTNYGSWQYNNQILGGQENSTRLYFYDSSNTLLFNVIQGNYATVARFAYADGSGVSFLSAIPSNQTWYYSEVSYTDGASTYSFTILDSSSNMIESISGVSVKNTGTVATILIYGYGTGAYHDNVIYGNALNPSISLGNQETPIKTFDFTLSYPSTDCVQYQGSTDAGTSCERCFAESTDTIPPLDTIDINCQGQNVGTGIAFLLFNFTGDADTFDLNMDLNATPTTGLTLKARCNSGDSIGATTITTTSQLICTDITPSGTQDANIFLWLNFTNYTPSDFNVVRSVDINAGEFS